MNSFYSRFHVLVVFCFIAAGFRPALAIQTSEFQSIFNGKDLSGWSGDSRLWSVKDGAIRGETTPEKKASRNTFLIWEGGALKDFELKISFRCNATNNSGIQYRSTKMPAFKDNKWRVKGYQHEIRNENTVPNVPGFIYDEGGKRGRICLAGEKTVWKKDGKKKVIEKFMNKNEIRDLVRIDEWNEVRILAVGNHIQHFLNGKKIVDFTDNHPKFALFEGVLALQLHAGRPMWTEFKDIQLRKIDSPAKNNAKDKPKKMAGFQGKKIWPNMAPGETTSETGIARPNRNGEKNPILRIGNVTQPTYSFYPADKPNGNAMLVLPGGGLTILAAEHEGTEIADWLNKLGFHAFVLHYRVSDKNGMSEPKLKKATQDGQRALSLIRSNSKSYGIEEGKIGIIGFSAGGMTAANLASMRGERLYETIDAVDEVSAKPDFALLIYPALTGKETAKNFPPTFIIHTHDDFIPSERIAMFYVGLKKAKVAAELHVFRNGGHGYGLRPRKNSNVSTWPTQAAAFLNWQINS